MKPEFRIKKWRSTHGMTQEDVAHVLGMKQPNYARVESGAREFTRIQWHAFMMLRILVSRGFLGELKERILDAPYEERDYEKFWETGARHTKKNKYARKVRAENPFTGQVQEITTD